MAIALSDVRFWGITDIIQAALTNRYMSMVPLAHRESPLTVSRPAGLCARCRLFFFSALLRKKRPSIAFMTNIKASTADDGSALATCCCSFRLVAFEGLPFALKTLARHFPGSCSNALKSNPLYCIARPLRLHRGRKGEQRLAAANLAKPTRIPSARRL
jgi:hypothetical protein